MKAESKTNCKSQRLWLNTRKQHGSLTHEMTAIETICIRTVQDQTRTNSA